MVCEHLATLEGELTSNRVAITYRGQAWSKDCREWVYFDVVLDTASLAKRFSFSPCVTVHVNDDPKSGQERGFVCNQCHDAVIGLYEGSRVFK